MQEIPNTRAPLHRETMAELSSDAWTCPICLELAYKPCVNSCGHVFCFWCMHRAMNMFDSSHCPLCRDAYSYFPWICEKLHEFLSVAFADEYKDRAEATLEETENQAFSPELPAVDTSASSPVLSFSKEHFKCSHPSCGELMYRPIVLNCGHMMCGDTCARDNEGCPLKKCPACSSPAMGQHGTCQTVHGFLQTNFPSEQAERATAVCAAVANRSSSLSDERRQEAESTAVKPDEAPPPPLEGSSSTGSGSADEAETPPPSPFLGLERLRELCENFVHHGAGCDHCGHYPIVGERYSCVECSRDERMGFDLCGDCMNSGTEIFRGRFNQGHTPDHEMKKVNNTPNAIHIFQALNPEIPLAQLLSMLQLEMSPSDEDGSGPEHEVAEASRGMRQLSRELGMLYDPDEPDLDDAGALFDLLDNTPMPNWTHSGNEQGTEEASGEAGPQEQIRFPIFRRIRQRLSRRSSSNGQ